MGREIGANFQSDKKKKEFQVDNPYKTLDVQEEAMTLPNQLIKKQ